MLLTSANFLALLLTFYGMLVLMAVRALLKGLNK